MNGGKNVVGIDIAKRVFQLHWIDRETGEIVSLQIKRERFFEHAANRQSCLIGKEACGGAQPWARKLTAMGRPVKLLPGKAVKPFVTGNKNDRQDARAIWTAVQEPDVKAVAIKTEEQQAILALHRMRSQLVKFRTAQINGLRGLLTEYGEVMPQGKAGVRKDLAEALSRLADRLPAMVIGTLREQWARIKKLDGEIAAIKQRIQLWLKQDDACKRIAEIPGVGPLTATAAEAILGDARAFKSGREFAAFAVLAPRQIGTGGRIKLLGISKRGDTCLRTPLIHGARSVLTHAKDPGPWVTELRRRRLLNVAVVGLANKMARTIWAMLAHERTHQKEFVSQPVWGWRTTCISTTWRQTMDYSKRFFVKPGTRLSLAAIDPAFTGEHTSSDTALAEIQRNVARMDELQALLYADGKQSLLVVLQALDAAGKDGVVRHLFTGMNPQGTSVFGFKQPSAEEAAHDFLWRAHQRTPATGQVVVFNRSHYEDVLVVRVHDLVPKVVWSKRYALIKDFEAILVQNGTRILKFFLHISPEEQLARFKQRLDDPARNWKISEADYSERELWPEYVAAYEEALSRTSTRSAPWYVIPANHKWFRNLAISQIIADTMAGMGLKLPPTRVNLQAVTARYHAAVEAQNQRADKAAKGDGKT